MGIALNAVNLLSQTLPLLGDLSDKKLLTLAVQDCHFTYDTIVRFLGHHGIPYKPLRAADILLTTGFKWAPSGMVAKSRNCIHQITLFQLLGFSRENIYSLDASAYEGADIIHDLNVPVDDSLHSKFDLVLESGTIEHVFSVKDALFNMCRMCKIGGVVVNFSPVDYFNHGFINLNAEILRDCFLANGFEEISLKYIVTPASPRRVDQYYLEYGADRFRFALPPYYKAAVYSAYLKIEEKALTVPMQGFYRKLHAGYAVFTQWQPSGLRAILSRVAQDWVDPYLVLSVIIRGFVNLWRGKKVVL